MAFPLFGKPVNTVVTEQTIWMEIDFDFFEIAFGLVVAWGFFILLELDLIRRKISPQVVQGDDVMAIGESAKAAPVKAAKAQTKAAAKDRSIGAGANPTKWIMDTAGDAMGSVGRAIDGLNMKPKPPAVAVQKSKPSGKKTRALPNTTSVSFLFSSWLTRTGCVPVVTCRVVHVILRASFFLKNLRPISDKPFHCTKLALVN